MNLVLILSQIQALCFSVDPQKSSHILSKQCSCLLLEMFLVSSWVCLFEHTHTHRVVPFHSCLIQSQFGIFQTVLNFQKGLQLLGSVCLSMLVSRRGLLGAVVHSAYTRVCATMSGVCTLPRYKLHISDLEPVAVFLDLKHFCLSLTGQHAQVWNGSLYLLMKHSLLPVLSR